MEIGSTSNSQNVPQPLFPAYSQNKNVETKEEKKDWLCNDSFTKDTLKDVYIQLPPVTEVALETIPELTKRKKEKKEIRNRDYKKKEHKKCPDPLSFSVPENESILCQLKKKTFIEETGLSFERAFLSDVTRDEENLMYECFERTKIANYRIRDDTPFGLSGKEVFLWRLSFPKTKAREKENLRYFHKNFLKSFKTSKEICIAKEPFQNAVLEYIPLPKNSDNENTESTNIKPPFLDISSSWKLEKNEIKSVTSDITLCDSSTEKEIREKVVFFNKKLSENPNDIQLWLKFVAFQDDIITAETKTKKEILQSENCVTEKKLAILDKALKYNPKNVDLNIAKLKLSVNTLDKTELASLWENLIFINPNNPRVWQEYLLFIISDLNNFNVPHIIKLYSKCIRTLSNLNEGIIVSHEPLPDIMNNMLGIFNQLCYILYSCGYTEKAVAAYQALIEFNIFCEPAFEDLSLNEKITYFEPFWDSGAQRIGEDNSVGWAETVKRMKITFDHLSTDSDLNQFEDEILCKKLPLYETWIEFEQLRENHHWLPWRPNPDHDQTFEDVDDIERTVPFDDVSKFLFSVKSEEQKFLLILHFISFLGYDCHSLGCHNICNRAMYNPVNIEEYQNIANHLNLSHLFHHKMNPLYFKLYDFTEDKFNFINNVFCQVSNKFSLKYKTLLTYIWIKFRSHFVLEIKIEKSQRDISELKKFVKSVLKNNENRNCLLLWFEYISIEWHTNKQSAIKTFHTLLMSSTSAVLSGNMEIQELWYFVQVFLDFYLKHSNESSDKIISSSEIVWILIHTVIKENYIPCSTEEIKPTVILKTITAFKNFLEKELNFLCETQNLCYCINPYAYSVINCMKCFAYFYYFYQDCDNALHVYEDVASFVNAKLAEHWKKYILEQICISKAELLNYHVWNSSSSIKPLKNFLHDSIQNFPNNSRLLYLLLKLRHASSVINPTRRFFTQILKSNKNHPITWIFALAAEFAVCYSLLLQSEFDNQNESLNTIISCMGINWKIRSLYEDMLKSEFCTHVPILWRSYMKFEILTQNNEKAKSVFHRALQNCGWSKALLMDGIEYFPEELKQIMSFMTQKQIHVRTPLEEVTLLMEHAITDS